MRACERASDERELPSIHPSSPVGGPTATYLQPNAARKLTTSHGLGWRTWPGSSLGLRPLGTGSWMDGHY